MKIALTGASSTGKTSVAHRFVDSRYAKIHNYQILGVDSRALLRTLDLGSSEAISSSDYRVFQTMYISRKIHIESHKMNFVTERSYADCLAYWRIHCQPTATPEENDLIHKICMKFVMSYDFHFLFPTGYLTIEDDGYRHTLEEYHANFQTELERIFDEGKITPIVMPRASIEERTAFLISEIHA